MAHKSNTTNPFIYGPPIPPEKFIGRKREVDIILDRLENPYNRGGSMVSGRSGIGKTSLLHYLGAEQTRNRRVGLGPEVAHFVYMPMEFIFPFSEAKFWEYLFGEIEDWLGSESGMERIIKSLKAGSLPSRLDVSRFFTRLGADKNKFAIVLLDGFDLLMQQINEDESEAGLVFLHTLRALLNLPAPRGFSMITSSEFELYELFKNVPWFGSGFYSNMANLPLGPFNETEIDDLLDTYLDDTRINFSDDDRNHLKKTSLGHPKKLQQAAHLLFEKHKESLLTTIKQVNKKMSSGPELDTDSISFDVFLAHNSQDKPQIEVIAEELRQRGLKPWLDNWHLPPGRRFIQEIEQVLPKTKSVAVFVGESGIGPWQDQEIHVILDLFAKKKRPVVPVLLPGIEEAPELPLFLRQFKWVCFTNKIDDRKTMDELVWGITGKHPRRNAVLDPNLVNIVVETYKLLITISQDVFEAVRIEPALPIDEPKKLKTALSEKADLASQGMKIDEIKTSVEELRQHKQMWDDYRKEEIKLEVPSIVKDALKQARENEERAIRSKGLSLEQQLEELTGYTIELPGLE